MPEYTFEITQPFLTPRQEIGKTCYEGYKNSVGGKTWNGENMLTYEEMVKIGKSEHWDYAGCQVINMITKQSNQDGYALKYVKD